MLVILLNYLTIKSLLLLVLFGGGAVAPWLGCSSPDRAIRVQALAGDIIFCSWARPLTVIVPLTTQVYKFMYTEEFKLGRGQPCGELAYHLGGH